MKLDSPYNSVEDLVLIPWRTIGSFRWCGQEHTADVIIVAVAAVVTYSLVCLKL